MNCVIYFTSLAVACEYEPYRDVKTLVSNAWGTNVVSTFAYTYDPIGRRTQRIDDATTTNLFAYNPRSELTSAAMGTNSYAYAYDPIGNRLSSSENGTTTTYAANSLNQYTALNPTSPNPTPFTYDPDGNMTSDGRFVYTWNGENRMGMASNDEVVVTYTYDHQGRMIRKEISREGVAERRISYIWDNWNIIRETLTTNNTPLITHNVWGLDLDGTLQGAGGVGGLHAVVRDNGFYIPTYDANGNVSEYITSTDGTIAAHCEYSPFGNPVVSMGVCEIFTHWFSTKPWCVATLFSEYQIRKYGPTIGRWMSRDPADEDGFICLNTQYANVESSENLYWFVQQTIDYIGLGPPPKSGPPNYGRGEKWKRHLDGTYTDPKGHNWRGHDGDKDPYAKRHKDHWDVVEKKGKKTRRDPHTGEDIGDAVDEERNEAENRQRSASLMWPSA